MFCASTKFVIFLLLTFIQEATFHKIFTVNLSIFIESLVVSLILTLSTVTQVCQTVTIDIDAPILPT